MNTTKMNSTTDDTDSIGTDPIEWGIAEHEATISRKRRMLAGLASIAALAGAGGAWAGIAGPATAGATTPPPLPTSVTMTITNHSSVPEQLVSWDPDGGWWIQEPQRILQPGQTETVIAATHSPEQYVQVNYIAQNPQQSQITYGLHTSSRGTDQFNTGVSNKDFTIHTNIQTGFPNAAARFDLS